MREIVKIFDMGPFDFQVYSQRALRTTIKTRLSPIFYCENNKNFEWLFLWYIKMGKKRDLRENGSSQHRRFIWNFIIVYQI